MAVKAPVRLTVTQQQTLGALKDGPVNSRKEIYDRAGGKIVNVTRVLQRLRDRGFINYTHDDPGKRFRASLTARGRSAIR